MCPRAGERVLVLEDDPRVRTLAVLMLSDLGYQVAEAGDAVAAKALLDEGQRFDLVLSDVVLPGGISGPDFALEAAADDPDLRFVFMSGLSCRSGGEQRSPRFGQHPARQALPPREAGERCARDAGTRLTIGFGFGSVIWIAGAFGQPPAVMRCVRRLASSPLFRNLAFG